MKDYNTADYYTQEEAAKLLGIEKSSVRQRIHREKYKDIVPCKCRQKSQLIAKSEIDEEINKNAKA